MTPAMRTVRSLIERPWVEKALAWAPAPLRQSSARIAAIVAATVAVVVALGAIFAALGPVGSGKPAKLSAPPWYAGEIPCREDPMAHVHDASRFIVVARCATVSGTVKSAHLDPADGTLKVQVNPDSAYRHYLTAANRGLLTAGVIPPDLPSVAAPASGQHLTLYGAWVEERVVNGVGRVRLQPTWGIQVSDAGQPVATSTASQSRLQQPASTPSGTPHIDLSESLSLTITVAPSVAVGSPMSVSITVKSLLEGQPKPAPAAALYCEVVGDRGRQVQWKAASANANGVARVDLLASGPPGEYTLWVYAHKGVQGGIGRAKVSVTRG
jgi:hypothetical protein